MAKIRRPDKGAATASWPDWIWEGRYEAAERMLRERGGVREGEDGRVVRFRLSREHQAAVDQFREERGLSWREFQGLKMADPRWGGIA